MSYKIINIKIGLKGFKVTRLYQNNSRLEEKPALFRKELILMARVSWHIKIVRQIQC